jgi:hypothetical protein
MGFADPGSEVALMLSGLTIMTTLAVRGLTQESHEAIQREVAFAT